MPAFESPEKLLLRVHITDTWTASDFQEALRCVEYLYNLRLQLDDYDDYLEMFARRDVTEGWPAAFWLSSPYASEPMYSALLDGYSSGYKYARLFHRDELLRVRRLNYGSDGSIDFLGLGKVIEAIGAWFAAAWNHKAIEEGIALDNEAKRLANGHQRIQNARAFQQLRAEEAYSERIVALSRRPDRTDEIEREAATLFRLIEEGKVVSAELLRYDEEDATERR